MDRERANLISKRLPLLLWLLSAPFIFSLIFVTPVDRAQEARVLETAREMVGQGWQNWMVPHCNAQVRLRKPPLTYWMAAASFEVFGVHDWAGRIPFAIALWLFLGATYAACRPLIGRRAALIGSTALAGCYFFVRFGRFAETDIPSALFVTAAIAAIIRGALSRRIRDQAIFYTASGAAIGLAAMSKGPPAIFPALVVIAFAWAMGRWRIVVDFLLKGGLLAAIVVGVPWWIYVSQRPEFAIVGDEISELVAATGHPAPPWFYFLVIFPATAPWSGLVVLGIAAAIRRWRVDLRARLLLLWIACIFIPLSVVAQKQDHYILPLLAPLAASVGWVLDRAVRKVDPQLPRATVLTMLATAAVGLLAGASYLVPFSKSMRGRVLPIDFALCAFVTLATGAFLIGWNNQRIRMLVRDEFRFFLVFMILGAVWMTAIAAVWLPSLERKNYREVAAQIGRDFGSGPLIMYEAENLPLCFYMGRPIPFYATRAALNEALVARPDSLIIWEQRREGGSPPPGRERLRIRMNKRHIVIYQGPGSA